MPHPKLSRPLRKFRVGLYESREVFQSHGPDHPGDAHSPKRCGHPLSQVLKIVVNDTIHPITDEYIGRALDRSEDTPRPRRC